MDEVLEKSGLHSGAEKWVVEQPTSFVPLGRGRNLNGGTGNFDCYYWCCQVGYCFSNGVCPPASALCGRRRNLRSGDLDVDSSSVQSEGRSLQDEQLSASTSSVKVDDQIREYKTKIHDYEEDS